MEPKLNAKAWDASIEEKVRERWKEDYATLYSFTVDHTKKPFVIDTPPPYPSGKPWHIGAAAHYSQIDMIARTARMLGYNVYFPIGIDRNGLPVEIYTERKYKINIRSVDRERFLELCKEALDELEREMIEVMRLLGLSGTLDDHYRTDSDEYRALTQSTFIELWNRGLVYEATRPNNYCYDCGTTIADAEIAYREMPTKLVHINFELKRGEDDSSSNSNNNEYDSKSITIATTRPELLCSCRAVIVNPDDHRYKHLHGRYATVPIYNNEVKIIPHPSADMNFGSGAVMVCSYGDHNDVRLFRELGLEEVIAIDTNGCMTSNAGRYEGMKVNKAREAIIEDLRREGLILKEESIMHRTPVCERSNTPIEIIPMNEYYIKQLEFIEVMKDIAYRMRFYPEMHRHILLNWLNSITIDWPISRRRYYATEIPIWYCKSCKRPNIPEKGRYYRPWKDEPPFKQCRYCNGSEFIGEDRTFDTWMDSSITPLFICRYGKNEDFFNYTYPVKMRPQAKDIVRTWLHYTVLRCYQLTDKAPFESAWIMGYGLDEKGERMSKSKGNVIDPMPIIKRYGADAFRFWSASEVNLGYDFRCSEQRIANAQRFLTKLWNTARFISSFPYPESKSIDDLHPTDRWILAELSVLVERCIKGYNEFNFFIPSNAVREFIWNIFAPHYIEMVKTRAYGQMGEEKQRSACYTLHRCLSTILLLLAPITPFITDYIWMTLYSNQSIHKERLPTESEYDKRGMLKYTDMIVDFNSSIWNRKKSEGKSLKDAIEADIPEVLEPFKDDIISMHNIVRRQG